MERKQLLTSQELDVILHRLACQLIENHTDFSDTVLIGLQPRGVFLAQRLVAMLRQEYQVAMISEEVKSLWRPTPPIFLSW